MRSIDGYLAEHVRPIEELRSQRSVIERIGKLIVDCLRGGGCVFWLGNGGSAADCQHLAAELVGRFERDRQTTPQESRRPTSSSAISYAIWPKRS